VQGDLAALLVEGLLRGRGGESLTREQTYGHPSFFPFDMAVSTYDLRQRPQFEVTRQGIDMEMVMLRQVRS
jgi:hypothetical protein